MKENTNKLIAELLGTFALVFVGAGAVIVESHTGMSHQGLPSGKVGLVGIALAHGLTLAGMIYALGSISGGHFNPAVSLAVWLRQKLEGSLFAGYVLAQLVGALVAAMALAALFPDEVSLAALGTPALAPNITVLKGAMFEAIITFLLVIVVLFSTRDDGRDKGFAGLAIGGTLAGLIFFAGPMTGAGANPARFLGPALISGHLTEAIAYLAGPLIGGGLAGLLAGFMMAEAGEGASESEEVQEEAKDPEDRIRLANELLDDGAGEEAAAVLVPLLKGIETQPRELVKTLRTLVIVIEEEYGDLKILDPYQHIIYPAPEPG